jgi:hypothetical protein
MLNACLLYPILTELEFDRQILLNISKINIHKNPYSESQGQLQTDRQTDRQTDMKKLIFAFRCRFEKGPKKYFLEK